MFWAAQLSCLGLDLLMIWSAGTALEYKCLLPRLCASAEAYMSVSQ